MKKIMVIICFSISFILCGILVNTNSALSDEKQTMTMTEFYESGAESAKNMIITIGSKEELMLFNTYLREGKDTDRGTFRLTSDIYWSDYRFRYDRASDRIGVYKGESLEVVYKWEIDKKENTLKAREYKDFVTEEENTGEKYQFDADYWTLGEYNDYSKLKIMGDFDGNHHTIYGFFLADPLFYRMYGNIENLTLSSVYSERDGNLVYELYGNIQNCKIEDGYGFCGMVDHVSGEVVIEKCDVDAYLIDDGFSNGYIGMILGIVYGEGKIEIRDITTSGKIIGNRKDTVGGIAGSLSPDYMVSCKSDVDIEGNFIYAGGIAGVCSGYRNIVKNCINEGNITVGGSIGAGGIFGYSGGVLSNITMTQCINKGEVKAKGKCGGIIGKIDSHNCIEIKNCTNEGNIYAMGEAELQSSILEVKPCSGGIVGDIIKSQPFSSGFYQMEIENCINHGNIFSIEGYAGGICNEAKTETPADSDVCISNCYTTGEIICEDGKSGEIAGISYGSLQYCYYSKRENSQPVGIQEGGTVTDIYAVTEDQLLGRETDTEIAPAGHAKAYTLKDALNNWVKASKKEGIYYWVDEKKGPMWKEGIRLPEITPEVTPTPTPTPIETPAPTAKPTPVPPTPVTSTPKPAPTATVKPAAVTTPVSSPSGKPETKKKAKAKKMRAPAFTLKKKKTSSGRRYVRIRLKKYEGKYIEIKVKKKKKFYRLKLKNSNIKKNKKVFNFSYSSQKGTLTFQIRTYVKKGKKKIYSKKSKKKRIRLS